MKQRNDLMPVDEHLLGVLVPVAVPHVGGGEAGLGGGRVEAGGARARDGHLGVALPGRALHADELAARRRARAAAQQPERHALRHLRRQRRLLERTHTQHITHCAILPITVDDNWKFDKQQNMLPRCVKYVQ